MGEPVDSPVGQDWAILELLLLLGNADLEQEQEQLREKRNRSSKREELLAT